MLWVRLLPYCFCNSHLTNLPITGHWLLTELLTPALIAATEGGPSPNSKARVVTVSSAAAYLRGLDFNAFVDSPQRSKIPLFGLYAQSKFVCTPVSYLANGVKT